MRLWLKLRNRFVSPLVVAIIDSINGDRDDWLWYEGACGKSCTLKHASQRFCVVLLEKGGARIYSTSEAHPVLSLNVLESFLLARAVRSWVTEYHKQVMKFIFAVTQDWKKA